ncbi:MAG: DoxX family protein [Cytophagia bacterium]|nr:DoxX family protein [Cytophagia bacterium]
MKILYAISRYFVGGLFIFSGLIKINDPVGTQIKLEEYFEVFSSDFTSLFEYFVPFALVLSVILCTLEVVVGVALLLNYRMKVTSSITFSLILFFTFLTFYSAYYNKVTDCGCFGDAIKLTPWESFTKDVVLLFFSSIILLLANKYKEIKGLIYIKFLDYDNKPLRDGVVIGALIICLFISFYAINFLPFIDFRAYKIGNNIRKEMLPSEELIYSYIMEKDGKEYSFGSYPSDQSYTFKELRLLNPEAQPKITDYSIWNNDEDYTEESLSDNKLMIIIHDIEKFDKSIIPEIIELEQFISFWIETIVVTSSDPNLYNEFAEKENFNIPTMYADATVLKTIIRSNPGFFLMKNGIVRGKWHYNKIPNPQEVLKSAGYKL